MIKLQKPAPKRLVKVGKIEKTKVKNEKVVNTKKMKKTNKTVSTPPFNKMAIKETGISNEITKKKDEKFKKSGKEKGKKDKHKPEPEPEPEIASVSNPKKPAVVPKIVNEDVKKDDSKKQKKPKTTKDDAVTGSVSKASSKHLTKMERKKAAVRAFRAQKAASKTKKPKTVQAVFEATSFDQEKFDAIVNEDTIKNIVSALNKIVAKEVSEKKATVFDDYRYILNVGRYKIPNCPKRMVKLNVKHSLVNEDDDVVIIVPDLKRGAKIDYEPTIQHYEDVFAKADVKGLKIMPFNQMRNEYTSFESVRKLSNTYDYFLCDGRIIGQVVGFCGKVFQKPRTTFHAVRLENVKNIKNEIEKSLRRTAFKQLSKGPLISIPVGSHKQNAKQVAENVKCVVEQLKKLNPGGLPNVRSIFLGIDIVGTSALPIYVSTFEAPSETPYIVGPREERVLKLKRDANKVLANFEMTKDGNIVKVSKKAAAAKRKQQETHAMLLAEKKQGIKSQKDNEGEESGVPAKKARKEQPIEKEEKGESEANKDSDDEAGNDDSDPDDLDDLDEEDAGDDDNGDEGEEDDEEGEDEDDVEDDDDEDDAEDDDDEDDADADEDGDASEDGSGNDDGTGPDDDDASD